MSSVLLIDVGNTRLKWAVLDNGSLGPQQAQPHAGWTADHIRTHVLANTARPSRVIVSNVGGEQLATILREAVAAEWGLEPKFPVSIARAGGIENAYPVPQQLGVDRWMAMIGARAKVPGPACVVSVGTAMTVDGVTAQGRHVGGLILPGPDLMVSSLLTNTSDLAARSVPMPSGASLFADNTRSAIHQGSVHALAALVDRAMSTLQSSCGTRPTLLMTGGAAPRIEPLVAGPVVGVPDLVLRGLAVLADEM
jgi:type III pantothenate kinase